MRFIKQYFCEHQIEVTTESQVNDGFYVVKSLIKCGKCKKTFPQHPFAKCCHVEHIQTQLMYDYWLERMKEKHNINPTQGAYHEI